MTFPLTITYRDMEATPSLESSIHHWTDRLDRVYDRIERCEVSIERPHQHQHTGQRVRVCVRVAVPGADVVVSRERGLDPAHEDAYVAIRDAFRAARRRVQDHAHRLRGD
jgi:ribosome-associated translation inhibitor RaiA